MWVSRCVSRVNIASGVEQGGITQQLVLAFCFGLLHSHSQARLTSPPSCCFHAKHIALEGSGTVVICCWLAIAVVVFFFLPISIMVLHSVSRYTFCRMTWDLRLAVSDDLHLETHVCLAKGHVIRSSVMKSRGAAGPGFRLSKSDPSCAKSRWSRLSLTCRFWPIWESPESGGTKPVSKDLYLSLARRIST